MKPRRVPRMFLGSLPVLMALGCKARFAVFAQVYRAGHFLSVHGADEFVREMLALNALAAAEMNLIGGH